MTADNSDVPVNIGLHHHGDEPEVSIFMISIINFHDIVPCLRINYHT